MAAAESATNGIAPNAEKARSNAPDENGNSQASACTSGTLIRFAGPRDGVRQHPGRQVHRNGERRPGRRGSATPTPSRTHLEARRPETSPSSRTPALAHVLGTPQQVDVSEVVAVLGLIRVRVGVPPPPVGRPGDLLVRGPLAGPGRPDRQGPDEPASGRSGQGSVLGLWRRHGTMVAPPTARVSTPRGPPDGPRPQRRPSHRTARDGRRWPVHARLPDRVAMA